VATDHGVADPARYALLALLLQHPAHGYELSRAFAGGSVLADILHLGQSNVYALLSRMERDGLVTAAEVEAGDRPTRRVYALTERGREAVSAWLDATVSHPRDMRIEFPLKLYLLTRSRPAHALDLIARQRAVFRAYIERLERTAGEPSGKDEDFLRLVRVGRHGRAQAALEWLDAAERVVQARS